jgi:hypothetical protein
VREYPGTAASSQLTRPVGTGIVDHEHLEWPSLLLEDADHAADDLFDGLGLVVGRDHDADAELHWLVHG